MRAILSGLNALKFHGNMYSLEPTSAYIFEIWFHSDFFLIICTCYGLNMKYFFH